MKIVHTGDLHIGKYVHDISMLEDQSYILDQIFEIAVRESADVLLIAGDVYDRSVPTAEAVTLLDGFLTKVLGKGIQVIMISGNHDSPERVAFASRILEKEGLHITGPYKQSVKKITLEDPFGKAAFFCVPYCKPGTLGVVNCQEAVMKMLETAEKDPEQRNILLTHYFVTDGAGEPMLSDSETMVHVGGLDNVDVSVFGDFDYVALGHIHRPQQIGGRPVYYAGSPLKYSFSEALHDKSVNIVTMGRKHDMQVRREKLRPRHEMRLIKGSLQEILRAAEGKRDEDYVQVTLTDEEEVYDPIGTLRAVYPNIMQLLLSKNIDEKMGETGAFQAERGRSPLEMYRDFYVQVRGKEMDEERMRIVEEVMQEAGGE